MEGCCYMEQNLAEQWASQHLVGNDAADGNSYNKKGFYSFYLTTMGPLNEWIKSTGSAKLEEVENQLPMFCTLCMLKILAPTQMLSVIQAHICSCWMWVRLCWELRQFTKNVNFSCLNRLSQQGRSISQTWVCTKYRKVRWSHATFSSDVVSIDLALNSNDLISNYLKPTRSQMTWTRLEGLESYLSWDLKLELDLSRITWTWSWMTWHVRFQVICDGFKTSGNSFGTCFLMTWNLTQTCFEWLNTRCVLVSDYLILDLNLTETTWILTQTDLNMTRHFTLMTWDVTHSKFNDWRLYLHIAPRCKNKLRTLIYFWALSFVWYVIEAEQVLWELHYRGIRYKI